MTKYSWIKPRVEPYPMCSLCGEEITKDWCLRYNGHNICEDCSEIIYRAYEEL